MNRVNFGNPDKSRTRVRDIGKRNGNSAHWGKGPAHSSRFSGILFQLRTRNSIRVRPSVRPSIHLSVCPSIHLSVRNDQVGKCENAHFCPHPSATSGCVSGLASFLPSSIYFSLRFLTCKSIISSSNEYRNSLEVEEQRKKNKHHSTTERMHGRQLALPSPYPHQIGWLPQWKKFTSTSQK